MTVDRFTDVLQHLRTVRHGMSLRGKDVARRMGVHDNYVTDLETRGAPTFGTLNRYARALGLKLSVRIERDTDCKHMLGIEHYSHEPSRPFYVGETRGRADDEDVFTFCPLCGTELTE